MSLLLQSLTSEVRWYQITLGLARPFSVWGKKLTLSQPKLGHLSMHIMVNAISSKVCALSLSADTGNSLALPSLQPPFLQVFVSIHNMLLEPPLLQTNRPCSPSIFPRGRYTHLRSSSLEYLQYVHYTLVLISPILQLCRPRQCWGDGKDHMLTTHEKLLFKELEILCRISCSITLSGITARLTSL